MREYKGPALEVREEGSNSTVFTIPSEIRHGLELEPGETPAVQYDPETREVSLSFE